MNAAWNSIIAVATVIGVWESRKVLPKAVAWLCAQIAGPQPRPPTVIATCAVPQPVDGPTERLATRRPVEAPRRSLLGAAFHRSQPPTVEIMPAAPADNAAPLFTKTRGEWHLLHPEFQTGTTTAVKPLRPNEV